jgi:predicted metal-binding membrane protein
MAHSPGLSSGALRLRQAAWIVPEWPWLVLVSGSWVTLAGHAVHALGPGEWVVMVVAMMLPATVPVARAISLEGLWARRYRAPAIFLATYVAIWSLYGALVLGVWSLLEDRGGSEHATLAIGAILVAGAGWQFTKQHRRFLKRCHRRRPVGVRGRRADRACVRYGAYHARQCGGACWPLMLAMVPAHPPALMLGVGALSTWQRLARRPRRDVAAVTLVGLALLTLAL